MTYGCNNKPRPTEESKYTAQAGWSETFPAERGAVYRAPIYVEVKSAFGTTACQYDKSKSDKGCENCCWAKEKSE